jgi:hypothetical protein
MNAERLTLLPAVISQSASIGSPFDGYATYFSLSSLARAFTLLGSSSSARE